MQGAVRRIAILAVLFVLPLMIARSAEARESFELAADVDHSAASAVADYWTPERMRAAQPLDQISLLSASGRARWQEETANASFAAVPDATLPPYTAVGRVFLKIGAFAGFCSATAIDSESRRLVLTAGHCLYNVLPGHALPSFARYFSFVPAYSNGQAPFGEFVGRRGFLPPPWLRRGNPNFDMAAVLTYPNKAGQQLADAVGGGIPIAIDRPRDQEYQVLGYPGRDRKRMQECRAHFRTDDRLTFPLGGPPSIGVGCFMGEGASGGPWLIAGSEEGSFEVGGMTTYGHLRNFSTTFGPYFSRRNVGALVKGL
jgi:V8-like Glu-specific endopeptidase